MGVLELSGRTVNIAVVPHPFQGSTATVQAAEAITGLTTGFAESSVSTHVAPAPLADGGEGTVAAWQVNPRTINAHDALGHPVNAYSALCLNCRIPGIETAQANGLPHVSDVSRRPLKINSQGVGQIVAHALDAEVDMASLCIRGSVSTDGGISQLGAPGVRFIGAVGATMPNGSTEDLVLNTLGSPHPHQTKDATP